MEVLSQPPDLVTACRPTLHLSTILGLCPAPDPPSRPRWWLKLAHTVLVSVLVLSALGALVTARSLTVYPYSIPTMSVTDVAVLCLAASTSVACLAVFAAHGRAHVATALRRLQEVDHHLLAADAPRVYSKSVAVQVRAYSTHTLKMGRSEAIQSLGHGECGCAQPERPVYLMAQPFCHLRTHILKPTFRGAVVWCATDLGWREALGSNPGQGMGANLMELGVILFLVVLVFCYDNLVWYEGIIDRVVGLFAVYFVQLVNLMSMLQLINLALVIGHRLGRINDKLSSGELFVEPPAEKQISGTSVDGSGIALEVDELTQAARVWELSRLHDAICDAADSTNIAFGIQALFNMTTILVTVTMDVYFVVTFAQVVSSGQPAPRRTWDGLVVSLLWTAANLSKALGVVSACSWACVRAKRGAVLAQKALLREDVRSDAVIELQLLLQQMMVRKVKFTAWGVLPPQPFGILRHDRRHHHVPRHSAAVPADDQVTLPC
ncbi:hypothetical protein PR048_006790 [Dryococelus australis]|uniref:Gustatory receptor n=1 Tax=Dryococelus australis TaxID=614101 RepID=A0ABQ9IBW9_9NEOP|nr:hypothetical protein PR048_006790 [Dryococelus australis]